ncbi:hypothetical protein FN846DRAFT_495464 [Sphaerosporella brunnea]|uniref:DUF1770-domain-containing protein n=1 Tax=Sphaerosporella brunnea TaxID=1250544 RepID=A0A5J5F3J2_9PEZI|nr:hypothetical protein FN846DRAFT_495464 [Sphaerosporella brunnea]
MSDLPPLSAQTLAQNTHFEHAPPTAGEARFQRYHHPHEDLDNSDGDDDDDDDEDDRASISSSVPDRPARQHRPLPPLPDLRFEQSYLASIAPAQGVWWKIALITLKDQVLMPLLQGLGFNLALFGWRFWNRGVKFSGSSLGAQVRRWWWRTNNWQIPSR